MSETTNDIHGLRDELFAVMRQLREKDANAETVTRAKAVAEIAQTIINSARVEVDYLKLGETGSKFIPHEKPSLPSPGQPRLVKGRDMVGQMAKAPNPMPPDSAVKPPAPPAPPSPHRTIKPVIWPWWKPMPTPEEQAARGEDFDRAAGEQMFLTHAELADLTGRTRPSAQIRWLERRGWPFERDADGRVKVLRVLVDGLAPGAAAPAPAAPNFSAIGG